MDERKKILVVDDEEGWLQTTKRILESNYEVTLLEDHTKAAQYLKQQNFALVILDLNMPGTSGLEVLKQMREVDPNLRAIMLTGYANVDSAVESMKIGALDYISKGTGNLASALRTRVAQALARETVRSNRQNPSIAELIEMGESAELEFKASARWDIRNHRLNKELEKVVVKTVASFMNSDRGGTLLLGVDDSGLVVGLKGDYSTLGKRQNRDGYEHLLMTLLTDAFGTDCSPFIDVLFHKESEEDVCEVLVKPSPKPMFVQDDKAEHLFIRVGNSTRLLSTREAIEYCKVRWPTT